MINLKGIRSKPMFAFSGVLLVSFLLSAWCIFSIYKVLDYESLVPIVDRIKIQLLNLRYAEKNFLLRDVSNPQFFEKGESRDLSIFNRYDSALHHSVDSLSGLQSLHMLKELTDTKIALNEYVNTFYAVVQKIKKRGLGDRGDEGELRAAVRILQSDNRIDRTLVLDLRKNEKNFFLRKDLQYVKRFDAGIETLLKSLTSGKSEAILVARKRIEIYQEKFHQIVDAEKSIGLNENEGLLARLKATASQLDRTSGNLGRVAQSNVNRLVNRIILLIILAVLSQFGLGTVLSIHFSLAQNRNHRIINERDEEIQAQSEELMEANDALSILNNKIAGQKEEIQAQAEALAESNKNISGLNEELERKIKERTELLAESENRLRTIIQTDPECIKLLGANCEVLEMNPAGLAIIAADSLDQVLGQSVLHLVNPKHQQAFSTLTQEVFNGKTGRLEFEIINLKGTHRWIDMHAVPLRNNAGKVTSLLGVSRDITEQKLNEESLQRAEERYKSIFENSLNGIFQSTPEGKFLTANPTMASIFGYDSVEELLSVKDIATQFYSDPDVRNDIKNKLQTQGKMVLEYEAMKKNKEVIWILANMLAIRDEAGNVKYFEGTVKDVTERRRAEEALAKSHDGLSETLIFGKMGSAELDIKTLQLRVSKELFSLLDVTVTEAQIQPLDQFLKTYVDPGFINLVAQKIAGGISAVTAEERIIRVEFEMITATGRKIWIDGKGIFKGNIGLGILQDVTDKKEAANKLDEQFQSLQKTNQELDRFVYSASHDLRAPLASILGLINIAEMEKPSSVLVTYFDMIRKSIGRLDRFIKDILDYSRNARLTVKVDEINFTELMNETQENFKLYDGMERIKIVREMSNSIHFHSDASRIKILFNNLFSNSIKYHDFQKKSPIISVHISVSPDGACIKFFDNGIGIEKEHLDKIFDMFYRASENSKGSGLGLYIAKETIAKLGGSIKVNSELGAFTEFEISLPNMTSIKR